MDPVRRLRWLVLFAFVGLVAALPGGAGVDEGRGQVAGRFTAGPVALRAWMAQPQKAPERVREILSQARPRTLAPRAEHALPMTPVGRVFNHDTLGLPQNEESISACTKNRNYVLGGTNDYRGIVDPEGNFTGWQFSKTAGESLTNEGLMPPVEANGEALPSSGDPVFVLDAACTPYAADLNVLFQGDDFASAKSAVGVYRSSVRTLSTCPSPGATLTHPSCWPTRRSIDVAAPGHFLDKEWMDVGRSGTAGKVVWVAYGDLSAFNAEGNEESGVIKAVRCSADLGECTTPIVLSGGQTVAEYPDVTIGPDGRTYITWGEFFGGSFIGPTQQSWIAVAEPGSTTFTRHKIYLENQVMRGHETLHSADFRTGTMFKNAVVMHDGHPRVLVTWERCRVHAADQSCEEPEIVVTFSDDFGRTWSPQRVVSAGGDNYFPAIDVDPKTNRIVEAWYTHRFDPVFHNRQDVELATLSADGRVVRRQRVTRQSNETEADPLLGGVFIGDYIEVSAVGGRAYVAYNANARHVRLLGDGVPIPQQDNYLAKRRE